MACCNGDAQQAIFVSRHAAARYTHRWLAPAVSGSVFLVVRRTTAGASKP
jgi:hypothetical protein